MDVFWVPRFDAGPNGTTNQPNGIAVIRSDRRRVQSRVKAANDVWAADIRNAYFQSTELDRILLLRQPPGGIPDPDAPPLAASERA